MPGTSCSSTFLLFVLPLQLSVSQGSESHDSWASAVPNHVDVYKCYTSRELRKLTMRWLMVVEPQPNNRAEVWARAEIVAFPWCLPKLFVMHGSGV
jgi:hypothetical protein